MDDSKRKTRDFAEKNSTLPEGQYSISQYITFIGLAFGALTFVMFLGEIFNVIMFTFFIIAYVFIFLLSPIVAIFQKNKGEYIDFFDSFLIGIRGLLTISGIAAFYKIFISLDYDIYLSYWIILFSFISLISMENFEHILRKFFNIEDRDDILENEDDIEDEEKGLWGRIKKPLSIIVTAGLLYQQHYEPVLTLTKDDLAVPNSIQVSLVEKNENNYGNNWSFIQSKTLIETDDINIIENLWADLPNDDMNKLRYGELLNYQKVKRIYDEYYSIILLYDDDIRMNTDRENMADYIDIYPNGNVYILKYNLESYKTEIFPAYISEATLKSLGIN